MWNWDGFFCFCIFFFWEMEKKFWKRKKKKDSVGGFAMVSNDMRSGGWEEEAEEATGGWDKWTARVVRKRSCRCPSERCHRHRLGRHRLGRHRLGRHRHGHGHRLTGSPGRKSPVDPESVPTIQMISSPACGEIRGLRGPLLPFSPNPSHCRFPCCRRPLG